LDDNDSKFGTLVLVREPIKMTPNLNKIELQVGRTLLYLKVKYKWKFPGLCCSSNKAKSKLNQNQGSTITTRLTRPELRSEIEEENVNLIEEEKRENINRQYHQHSIDIHSLHDQSNSRFLVDYNNN